MSPALLALAKALHLARQGGPMAAALPGLTLTQAYTVAAHNHALRVAEGDAPIGRKIGHTHPERWASLGLAAPSWGWLYGRSTAFGTALPNDARWREPKVELELVLHLGRTPPPNADAPQWAACVDRVALGLEFVDRPYPAWGGSVADSVAAGGVHAGMWIGQALQGSASLFAGLNALRGTLRVGEAHSEGGSALVLGNPLDALAALQRVLTEQGAPPLQAGEWVTTGALAPALPYDATRPLVAAIEGPGFRLSV